MNTNEFTLDSSKDDIDFLDLSINDNVQIEMNCYYELFWRYHKLPRQDLIRTNEYIVFDLSDHQRDKR